MKRHRVRLTPEVQEDLVDLFEYIARKDSVTSANHVLDQLEQLILGLVQNPERGHYPPELSEIGVKDYREVFFKPYRVIYQLINNEVVVLGCFDGRRSMQLLLARRILR